MCVGCCSLIELEEHPDEAEHRVGRHPARVVERREGEEGAEDVVRAIDQKKLSPLLDHDRLRLSDARRKKKSVVFACGELRYWAQGRTSPGTANSSWLF